MIWKRVAHVGMREKLTKVTRRLNKTTHSITEPNLITKRCIFVIKLIVIVYIYI